MTERVEDPTVAALRTTLTRASRRAALVASNLANVDTPGYQALDLAFQEALGSVGTPGLETTHTGHIGTAPRGNDTGMVVTQPATRVRNDGNTVDVDREMTLLAAMQGRYSAAAEMVRKRFALLLYSATDGRTGS
jgi:flagellar basal-body rod protein FlgB